MPPNHAKSVLNNLRNVMKNANYVSQKLQAYIIPSSDAHQSEYLADSDKRRQYVSGFSGSAGTAIVTDTKAALWTDGRYFLQAEKELSSDWILMKENVVGTPSHGEWLAEILPCNSLVGVDPYCVSEEYWTELSTKLHSGGHNLVSVNVNLVDVVWENKPLPPLNFIEILPIEYTGMSWENKILSVREDMKKKNCSMLVLTALDEIAWLFNLRGSDIDYNPVFFAYAVITLDEIHLFVDEEKLTPPVKKVLETNDMKVQIHSYYDITSYLNSCETPKNIWISSTSSHALVSLVDKEKQVSEFNPVILRKCKKNEQEIKGMKNAHVKDAVALCEFFCWLESTLKKEKVTEISASEKLTSLRQLQKDFVKPSFPTISAAGPNGAIIHYRPTTESDREIDPNEMYLCDSGAQFRDGTTDVTRTWHFGTPSAYEKECYTRVIKGHIFLSSTIFPKFTRGQLLDTLARKNLWDVGLDYLHGTGHGVGMYLNVHEGPIGIHYRKRVNDPGLEEGMILSIEPGYYEEGKFGIRLENLAVLKQAKPKYTVKGRTFLTFEPLTLMPMQTKLLEPSMLTSDEVDWINDYHIECRRVIGNALQEQGKNNSLQWLMKETEPIG